LAGALLLAGCAVSGPDSYETSGASVSPSQPVESPAATDQPSAEPTPTTDSNSGQASAPVVTPTPIEELNSYQESGGGFVDMQEQIGIPDGTSISDLQVLKKMPKKGESAPWQFLQWGMDEELYITYGIGSSCYAGDSVVITETDEAVTIAFVIQKTGSGTCEDVFTSGFGLVHLPNPIGERELRHADLTGEGLKMAGFTD
jgi:hypothetical protein